MKMIALVLLITLTASCSIVMPTKIADRSKPDGPGFTCFAGGPIIDSFIGVLGLAGGIALVSAGDSGSSASDDSNFGDLGFGAGYSLLGAGALIAGMVYGISGLIGWSRYSGCRGELEQAQQVPVTPVPPAGAEQGRVGW